MKKINKDYEITKPEIEFILNKYEIGSLISYKILTKGSENLIIKISTSTGKYIIKIFIESKNKYYLHYEKNLLNYLTKNNIPVSQIIKSKKAYITNFHDKQTVIMKFLEGSHKYKPNIYLSKNLGEFLGKFHKKIHNYKPVYYSKVSPSLSSNKLYYDLDSQLQNYPLKKYRDKIRNRMPCLLKTKYNNIPMGAIHNDFHQYNILFKDNKIIGLIDFQSFYGPLIYDIASAIVRFCFTKKGTINKVNLYEFIESYEKYRKITPEEKQILSEAIKFNILYVIEYFIPKGKRMPENYFDELELYFKMFDNINENKLKI